ncbi:MAG: hypothetical protein VX028_02120 [Nanoarchaeota archaeon]|nr:hypothetical protein [Nanoarchaeota archaeon]
MKFKQIFFLLISVLILVGCSSKQEIIIDPQCEQRALEKVPSQVTLSFEKAFNGYDNNELYYVLDSIVWSNGHANIIDRAFRKPTIAGLDPRYYYPIDKETKLDDSWQHSEDIEYFYDKETYAQYRYHFTLEATQEMVFEKKNNQISGLPEDDVTKGKRVFTIVESKVIFCGDDGQ